LAAGDMGEGESDAVVACSTPLWPTMMTAPSRPSPGLPHRAVAALEEDGFSGQPRLPLVAAPFRSPIASLQMPISSMERRLRPPRCSSPLSPVHRPLPLPRCTGVCAHALQKKNHFNPKILYGIDLEG
ncbi:hypothetical protein ACLOJK_022356, partial [Asimina triloba]